MLNIGKSIFILLIKSDRWTFLVSWFREATFLSSRPDFLSIFHASSVKSRIASPLPKLYDLDLQDLSCPEITAAELELR
jgi:hypothetical protein